MENKVFGQKGGQVGETDKLNIDSIIARLLEGETDLKISFLKMPFFLINFYVLVRGSRPGKNVQLTENEIRGLCLKSRELFLSQPILLELEAPLKICGEFFFLNLKKKPNFI